MKLQIMVDENTGRVIEEVVHMVVIGTAKAAVVSSIIRY